MTDSALTKFFVCFGWAAVTAAAVGVPSYQLAVYVSNTFVWGPIFLIPALSISPFLWFVLYYKGVKAFQSYSHTDDVPLPRISLIGGAFFGVAAVGLAMAAYYRW
jgi:hypothetical protein